MRLVPPLLPVACLLLLTDTVHAAITVLGQTPLGQIRATETTRTVAGPLETYAAYDDTLLTPPALPNPLPPLDYVLELADYAPWAGARRRIAGSFWGFSVEMSVMNQVFGKNSSYIPPPLLNLLSSLTQRAGSVHIRCGGNTQERAVLVPPDAVANHSTFSKELDENSQATTQTPHVVFTEDMFAMLAAISAFVPGVGWYLGIPFNQTAPYRLEIAEAAERELGESLKGFQCANEPDFYTDNGLRQLPYTPYDYFGEFADLIYQISTNDALPVKNNLVGPSVAGPLRWMLEDVYATGFLDAFYDSLSTVSVEHYPNDNCGAKFGGDYSKDPQDVFPQYLTHTSPASIVASFASGAQTAYAYGKEMVMFETNTASCGGFAGISDSFGAALWALDYGMAMADANFTRGLLHVGGQNDHYNPFTAPPTNQSQFNQWTVGAVFYSTLVMAEAVGHSGTARFVSLPNLSEFTPAYAVYEDDGLPGADGYTQGVRLSKVALFNYMDGAADTRVTIKLTDGIAIPAQLGVKRLSASSVSTKSPITWAGQTFGAKFDVNGSLAGTPEHEVVACNTLDNTCTVTIPAPGFALLFLDAALVAEDGAEGAGTTFTTTARTRTVGTATADPRVVATSNGHSGVDRDAQVGGTSPNSGGTANGAGRCVGGQSTGLLGLLVVMIMTVMAL